MAFKFKFAETKTVELPDGTQVEVREPTIQESKNYNAKLVEIGEDSVKQLSLAVDFLDELGFPKEYAQKSTVGNLLKFIQWLTSEKKS